MRVRGPLLAVQVVLVLAGCSDRPDSPRPAAQPSAATTRPAGPSTAAPPSRPRFAAEYTQICAHIPVGALPRGQDGVAAVGAALDRIPVGLPSRTVAREECPDGSPQPGAVPVRVVFAGELSGAQLVEAGQAVTAGIPGATAVSGPGEGTGVSVEVPWDGPDVPPLSSEQTAEVAGRLRTFSLQPGPPGTALLRYIGPPVTDEDLKRVAAVLEQAAGAPPGSADLRPWNGTDR